MIRSLAQAIAYLSIATALFLGLVGMAVVATMSPARGETGFALSPGDKVRITVFGEADLSGEFELDGEGVFAMPLIGPVPASGLDARKLEGAIAARLGDGYLRDPKVNVEILSLRPVYILGEVNNPGSYPWRAGLSILNAAAMAGGFTYRADEGDIEVTRGGAGDPVVMTPETVVRPGDVIRVNERFF